MKNLYQEYMKALGHPTVPVLFLDEDNFQKNLKWIKLHAGKKKIRLATKSIRSREILKKILASDDVFQGLMCYDLREALWLRSEGFSDILMGYPTMDKIALKELVKDPRDITLMVDLPEHLDFLEQEARASACSLSICLDIDLSMDLPGLRFGVYRSFVNSPKRLETFLDKLKFCPHLKLRGLMGYEAQIAGVIDKELPLVRLLKQLSIKQYQKRRLEIFDLLKSRGHTLEIINGGGTGSLLKTVEEDCVSEVTVGSGFFSPGLFDHYYDFALNPALAFTLPIVRRPEKNTFTCLGGGYIASGATDAMKQPHPYLPQGIKLLKHEGAGEVQTPFHYSGAEPLKVGDSIIMRHAKAGEICERFSHITIVSKDKIIKTVLTYRGEGKDFL